MYLAPLASRLFQERSSDVNALMAGMNGVGVSKSLQQLDSHATYLHSGRAAAICLAPSGPSMLSLTFKLVIALMAR